MSNVSKLIAQAKGEVGYQEGKSGGVWNNHQQYSPQVPGLEWSQNQPWCATFLSWVALKSGLPKYFPCTASTDTAAKWFKNRKQWHEYPAKGAWGFLGTNDDMYHVFLVADYDDEYVYTVEGNTNTNGSAQGDGVYELKRLRRSANIAGYGYPAFPEGMNSADPSYKVPADPNAKRPINVKNAIKSFKKLRDNAKANNNLKKANKAQAQIKQIKQTWPAS